ncbi:MAG: FAD-binding protein, partial [Desulfamplus sp.]|nr:FAD-binding protein [Desulfamplus sp.]
MSDNTNPFPPELNVRRNVPLKPYTSFKVGGAADYFAQPRDEDELLKIMEIARLKGIASTIMGGGTNILVMDRGVSGLVISLMKFKKDIKIEPYIKSFCSPEHDKTDQNSSCNQSGKGPYSNKFDKN